MLKQEQGSAENNVRLAMEAVILAYDIKTPEDLVHVLREMVDRNLLSHKLKVGETELSMADIIDAIARQIKERINE